MPRRVCYLGEAWGQQEERQKRAFVGDAGKELWHWSHLKREEVCVTNLCNFRPPKNRDPKPEEVLNEWPRLMGELGRVKPDIIVSFGRLPTSYILGKNIPMEVFHGLPIDMGSWHTTHDRDSVFDRFQLDSVVSDHLTTVIPCYHPAAILHNPELYKFFVEDMRNVKLFMKNELTWTVNNAIRTYRVSRGSARNSAGVADLLWIKDTVGANAAVDTEGTIESPICMTISDRPNRGKLVYL